MSKYCAVAVEAATYAIDRLYDYALPEHAREQAQPGCRVLVPFGRGNRRSEGVIILLRDSVRLPEKTKPVLELLDNEPVLDAEMLRLAVYMRERLFCTFFDCIRAILPAGLWFRKKETYTLAEHITSAQLSQLQEREDISGQLLQLFTLRQRTRLLSDFLEITPSAVRHLDALCAEGILFYQSNAVQRTLDKTERMLRLAVAPEEAMQRARRGHSQVRQDVISCLSDGMAIGWKELCYMTGATDSILKTMVKNGILEMFKQERLRTPDFSEVTPAAPVVLSAQQQQVFTSLTALQNTGKPQAALLYGVTGSGKTLVYIKLMQDALKSGHSAMILLPEIGLTAQLIRTFVAHFGNLVAVLHSALPAGERYDSWKKIRSGAAKIIVGTRSAVFAPAQSLGLIILDEEQDSAYKSEQSPRYHARDIAKFRAVRQNALIVFGSATPSVESYYLAQQGKYPIFKLTERYLGTALPQVVIADMRGALREEGYDGMLGQTMRQEIEKNLDKGEQTILFLNRRGNSRHIGCMQCGWTPQCPSCSTTLTYHSASGRAMCHFCGYSIKISEDCPQCDSSALHTAIPGTQKVEEELHMLYPSVRVLRMDADTTATRGAHEKLLEAFGAGRADILVGTQMVTKGLDFEKVTLAGVLDADQGLYAQDYRAWERTFSLITQVIGRAGRRFATGRAVIQTYTPEHQVLLTAARQDYDAFYQMEIERRAALKLPPMQQLLVLTVSGELEQQVLAAIMRLKNRIESLMLGQFRDFRYPVLGPAPATVVRVSGRYRYHLTMRCPDGKRRRQLFSGVLCEFMRDKQNKGISLFIDQNPDTM